MKTAKIFRNGQSQAVRLPKEFRFEGSEVFIQKRGNVVMLTPKVQNWASMLDSLDKFSSDFMQERVQPNLEKRSGISS